MDAYNNHIENNKTSKKAIVIKISGWLRLNKYAMKARTNTTCIPAGDNQNTCTFLLSHFIICSQHNITSETERKRGGNEGD
jgi:hypothetical protein